MAPMLGCSSRARVSPRGRKSIAADFNGPLDADGLPTRFIRSPTYGQALSPDDFYPGREFLMSLGVRF